jgi:hypothetical protein
MDESIKHGVVGIILAFVFGAAYILEMKLNDIQKEGHVRDRELATLKHNYEVKVQNLEFKLSSLKTTMKGLTEKIGMQNPLSGTSKPPVFYL